MVAGAWMPLDGWVTGAAGLLLLSRLVQQLEYFSHLRAVSTRTDPCDGSLHTAGVLVLGLVLFHGIMVWAVWDVGGSNLAVVATAAIPVIAALVWCGLWCTGWTSAFTGAWHELVREQVVHQRGIWALGTASAAALSGAAEHL